METAETHNSHSGTSSRAFQTFLFDFEVINARIAPQQIFVQ